METSVYKVNVWVDFNGKGFRVSENKAKETGKCYSWTGHRVSKDKLMQIETMFYENHDSIRYYTYCLEGDQQKALDMLKTHVCAKVNKYKEEIEILAGFLGLIGTNGKIVNHCEECGKELGSGTVFCTADCRRHYWSND